jgi:hypothetical protein
MSSLFRALFAGLIALGAVHSPSLAADPDPIGALLDQQKIKYEVDKDKDYKVIYDFSKEKRTQIVYVSGRTEDFEGIKIRSIFAPAAQLKKNSIDGQLKALLEANGKSKFGAWEIVGDDLFFSARLIEPFTADELGRLLNLVASVADDKEIEISGKSDEL